jgi:Type IV pilus assembly protein PilM
MLTTVEVSSRAIRLIRSDGKGVQDFEHFPVPAGSDPLQALENAPLPSPLGKVRVVMSHGDMLLRTMLQSPTSPERLDKLVHFELQNNGDEAVAVSWFSAEVPGADDLRLLTMTIKQKLIDQLKRALAKHGGKLAALTHPAIGLYETYRATVGVESGSAILVDIGGAHLHLALVHDGNLVFVRTQTPGMDELVRGVAELRTLPENDAAALVAKLGKGAPSDLHEAIKRQVSQIAGVLTANVRFAKAQLKFDALDPKAIWLTGAGAQVHGFIAALAERMGMAVKPLNPFSGIPVSGSSERLDRHSALPSPWAVAIGMARAKDVTLDALSDERIRAREHWQTKGVLRIAAAAVVALFVLALVRQELNIAGAQSSITKLNGTSDAPGLVPVAKDKRKKLDELSTTKGLDTSRLAWIDGERRPGRVALELLGAIAAQSNPTDCPVFLQNYKLTRQPGMVTVEIQGHAEGTGKFATDQVLHTFERGLVKRYPPIVAIKQRPQPIDSSRQQFHYILTISDQPAEAKASGGKALTIDLTVPNGVEPEGAARVAALRARTDQDAVTVQVARPGAKPQPVQITFKN